METERILSLDLSTKTGYALLVSSKDDMHLETYGQVEKIACPEEEPYPGSYVTWAYKCYEKVEELIESLHPDVLVVEEVTKSKNPFSQKILDFLHFLVSKFIQETGIKNFWYQTGEWRREVGSYMNDAERKRNKEVKEYKKKTGKKLARDITSNRVIGKVTKKHVSVRRANEIFNLCLKLVQNDAADAVLLAYAHHVTRCKKGIF